MRAAVYHGRRDVRVEQVDDPVGPPEDGLILRVARAAICGTDAAEWAHGPQVTANTPIVLGHEFVGEVVAAGGQAGFALGDRVVSGAGVSCGRCRWCRAGRTNLCASYATLGQQRDGGLAELVATPARICHKVLEGCSDDAAAMAQPLAVALHAVRRSAIAPGETVAVVGVGGIGAFVIAAARALGAGRIIALDIDPRRLAQATAIGADDTHNVAGSDLAAALLDATGGEGAPVVVEASGAPGAVLAAIAGTARGGRAILVGLPAERPPLDVVSLVVREIDLIASAAHVCDVDLPAALAVLDDDTLAERLLDRVIPLERLVDDGLLALVEGTAHGKVIVDPARGR